MPVDRTRRFALPGIQDLNKDQDEALALPLEGQHLIIGGPGTGKSVVALLRARRLADEKKRYRILVYNHLLNGSNRHLFGSQRGLNSETWDRWFWSTYRDIFGKSVPTIFQEDPNAFRQIDWSCVEDDVQKLSNPPYDNTVFLLVDEGQDLPKKFYYTLAQLGVENFYIVADDNQQIYPNNCSSRQEIEDALAINTIDTLELKTNYRNTRPIAMLAQHFYPANPASPRPELPSLKPSVATPELWVYGAAGHQSLNEIADRILKMSDRFPNKLIGIITPNNKIREKFYDSFNQASSILDGGRPSIQTFVHGRQAPLDFGQGGIMIINAQSCKGLEFDIAILADIDQHNPKHDIYVLKSRFYVMVARGRERVIMLRTGATCPIVESLLPNDQSILIKK